MIFILILILFLLSLFLFVYTCNKEGLDNCNTAPIAGSTAGEITNSTQISNLQNQINTLDSDLRQQVSTNTGQITTISNNIKELGDLRQTVTSLSDTIQKTQLAVQNIGQQLQQQSDNVTNQS